MPYSRRLDLNSENNSVKVVLSPTAILNMSLLPRFFERAARILACIAFST